MPRVRPTSHASASTLVLAVTLASCESPNDRRDPSTFFNPIAPLRASEAPALSSEGLDSADPFLFVWDGRYYLTHTGQTRVVLRSADTLAGLADAPIVEVFRPGEGGAPASLANALWAPEFHRLEGPDGMRWYVYVAAHDGDLSTQRQLVLESAGDDPFGPYTFKGVLDAVGFAIDATVFAVGGRTYLIYSGHATASFSPSSLFLGELASPWAFASPPIVISSPTEPWESTALAINEGPEVLLHGADLHVIYSADACTGPSYKLGRLTVPADANLLDPGTWANAKAPLPLFTTSEEARVFGPGHGSFFRSPDGTEDWQIYHATSSRDALTCIGGLPRLARAQRFTWNPDGTPSFGGPVSTDTPLTPPAGERTLVRQAELADGARALGGSLERTLDDRFIGTSALELRASAPGALLRFRVSVSEEGDHDVHVRLAVGPSRGIAGLRIDGAPPPSPTANAHAAVEDAADFSFGTVHLARGAHEFEFESIARGADDGGLDIGVDQVRLR